MFDTYVLTIETYAPRRMMWSSADLLTRFAKCCKLQAFFDFKLDSSIFSLFELGAYLYTVHVCVPSNSHHIAQKNKLNREKKTEIHYLIGTKIVRNNGW